MARVQHFQIQPQQCCPITVTISWSYTTFWLSKIPCLSCVSHAPFRHINYMRLTSCLFTAVSSVSRMVFKLCIPDLTTFILKYNLLIQYLQSETLPGTQNSCDPLFSLVPVYGSFRKIFTAQRIPSTFRMTMGI